MPNHADNLSQPASPPDAANPASNPIDSIPIPNQNSKLKNPKSFPQRHPRLFSTLYLLFSIALLLGLTRFFLPYYLRDYVNRTIDKDPLYDGTIGAVDVHLLDGGYTIHDVRLNKTTGNVPVPFFYADRVEISLEWSSLLSGKCVGKVTMQSPQLNFVDSNDPGSAQTGSGATSASAVPADQAPGGPWLQMIADLYPFRINSLHLHDGSIHFRAFDTSPPVDIYLSQLEGSVHNLTNIHDETTPLVTTVRASALAMDHAKFEFDMKLDPFSYRPTFQLATRLIGLDVTRINSLARAYGQFDFESGSFDLVVELNAREGTLDGYIKPLFRHITVFALVKDAQQDNPLQYFWEALVGLGTELFKNLPKDQFATLIPLTGDLTGPTPDYLSLIGNTLRNAFIRAYLPKFEPNSNSRANTPDINWLQFKQAQPAQAPAAQPDSITDPLPTKSESTR